MPAPIYLDHNATTPLSPAVRDAMLRVAAEVVGNPASQHAAGRLARKHLEHARERIVELLGGQTTGMRADRFLFTSGGTEANHLALLGLAGTPPGKIVVSAIEHPSVLGAAEVLQQRGFKIVRWPVTSAGIVDLTLVEKLLTDDVRLVSVMLANNETGVIQPITELAAICREAIPKAIVHCDAVQGVGKIPVHFRSLNIDALTVTPHKFHGPVGIGGLLLREELPLVPQMLGGFQQGGLRPGTESVALAVGFQAALEEWDAEREARAGRMLGLGDAFETMILRGFPAAEVIGSSTLRLPQTSNIAFPGVDRQALLMALDLAGVACSTGSACASGSSEPSPVLLAMGLADALITSAIRFSWGAFTTAAEIVESANRILNESNRLRHGKSP